MDPQIEQLGVQLAQIAIRNTFESVRQRVAAVKARKQDKETINELTTIINEVLDDKQNLVLIAKSYKSELVAQTISDDDIDYITSTVIPVLKKFVASASENGRNEQVANQQAGTEKIIETLESLLSKESITIVQLLGFNYKRAIGEPFTQLASRAILSHSIPNPSEQLKFQTLNLEVQRTLIELAQNPEAFARYIQLTRPTNPAPTR